MGDAEMSVLSQDTARRLVELIDPPAWKYVRINPVVLAAISRLLNDAMDEAVRNGANSTSMPDYLVEVAAWLAYSAP